MANKTPRPASAGKQRAFSDRRIRPGQGEAIWIGTVAVLGLCLAVVALQVTVTGVFRNKNPQLALRLSPYDAKARANLADAVSRPGATDPKPALQLARDALWRDALQPEALRVLAGAAGSSTFARAEAPSPLILEAERLSRRDRKTQMELIDYYGKRSDFPRMVAHFDIVLRSTESARPMVFPLLAAAANDPRVERLIMSKLAEHPNWAVQFAAYCISEGRDFAFAERVARLIFDPRDRKARGRFLYLVNRMAAAGRTDDAWNLYQTTVRTGRPAIAGLQNGNFATSPDGSAFDWTFLEEPDLWAARELGGDKSIVLKLAGANGRSGEVAWQTVRLAPGSHVAIARFGDVPGAIDARPELRIECVGGIRLGSIKPGGSATRAVARGAFNVPVGCRFQRVSVIVGASEEQPDPPPWIDDIAIL